MSNKISTFARSITNIAYNQRTSPQNCPLRGHPMLNLYYCGHGGRYNKICNTLLGVADRELLYKLL